MRGCALSRRYIDVCNCDMFNVVNMYLDHLKFCVVCINGRRYVCCGECYVVSNECHEPTSCLVQPIGAHCCDVIYFGCFGFRSELGFLNGGDICMLRRSSYPLSTNLSHYQMINTASDPDTRLHLPSSSSQQISRQASTSGNHHTV